MSSADDRVTIPSQEFDLADEFLCLGGGHDGSPKA